MTGLKSTYDKLEDIPEKLTARELFVEKDGKYVIAGIEGVKTEADFARIDAALKKEKADHKETKGKLGAWGDKNPEETQTQLDRIAELEALSKGKPSEAELDRLANERADRIANAKLAPTKRELEQLKAKNAELGGQVETFTKAEKRRKIHDEVRKAATGAGLRPEAVDDALTYADGAFELNDDGKAVTKEGVGVPPGIDAKNWLEEIQPRKPHWWPESVGGGAKGSKAAGGGGIGQNPWTHENWNMGQQLEIKQKHGEERAKQMAAAAGTKLGGLRPAPKKA